MPQDATERTAAWWRETTFGTGPGSANWDSDGSVVEFLAIEPNTEGLVRGTVPNRQMRRRGWATYPHLSGLKSSGTAEFGVYASGSAVTTAADSAAATFSLAELLYNALGGQHLGFASAVVTPSTTAPDITVGQGTNHPAGAAIFAMNTAGSTGQFAIVDSVAVDVLTLRTTLDAVADTVGAAIVAYPNTRALSNRDHASHLTHALYFRGEDSEDSYETLGCKLNLTALNDTDPGQDSIFQFGLMCRDFNAETLTQASLTGAPEGPTAPVVGRSGTSVRMANVGTAAMVDLGAYGFTFNPGITNKQVPGLGTQGVLGHNAGGTYDDTTLEVMVPYDNAWLTDFENAQLKHVLIQVGDQRGDAWGIYLPRCQIDVSKRGVSADETSMVLSIKALEFVGVTHTEGTDNYELERAKFQILIAA